jgi:hypothetical protein
MTEAEFNSLPGEGRLPVYEDYEPVVGDLERLLRSGFDTHRATDDPARAALLARGPEFMVACAIRREGDDGDPSIVAVFSRRRPAGRAAKEGGG